MIEFKGDRETYYVNPDRIAYVIKHVGVRYSYTRIHFSGEKTDYIQVEEQIEDVLAKLSMPETKA